MSEIESVHISKPWKKESFHLTFESADATRNKLLRIWKESPEHEGMQAKVHFLPSKRQYVVKTRLHPDAAPIKKETKKNVKRNKKNKRIDVDGKFDLQRDS